MVVAPGQRIDLETSALADGAPLTYLLVEHDAWSFSPDAAEHTLRDHFKTASLDGLGLSVAPVGRRTLPGATCAAGGLLHYLGHELRRNLGHVHTLRLWQREDVVILDAATRRNLELTDPLRARLAPDDASFRRGSHRDRGRRTAAAPMADRAAARPRRHRAAPERRGVGEDRTSPSAACCRNSCGRCATSSGSSRGWCRAAATRATCSPCASRSSNCPPCATRSRSMTSPRCANWAARITPLPELAELYARALADDPPMVLKEGGLIRNGHHAALDELRAAAVKGQEWLADLQRREQERTGIQSLKVRYNQVFGYYIEISAANLAAVPADYTRKQTLANAERFVTPELKEMEAKILGAQERSRQLEYELFLDLRAAAAPHLRTVQETARALHELDVLLGWGGLAQERDYFKPEVNDGGSLLLRGGAPSRHRAGRHAKNSCPTTCGSRSATSAWSSSPARTWRARAPTSGRSRCSRCSPTAAASSRAQRAVVGLLDRIFTRVGASDDLGRGQSTFMVEMNETANILNHATSRSLVILDEIGRGTSTFDGLSIAWSVAEYLCTTLRARTLFATHYHELTELARLLPATKNYNVAVREWGDQIVFLRKIVPGGTDKSYGIQVARLAGLPAPVLKRAKEILRQLEEDNLDDIGQPKLAKARQKKEKAKDVLRELDLVRPQRSSGGAVSGLSLIHSLARNLIHASHAGTVLTIFHTSSSSAAVMFGARVLVRAAQHSRWRSVP